MPIWSCTVVVRHSVTVSRHNAPILHKVTARAHIRFNALPLFVYLFWCLCFHCLILYALPVGRLIVYSVCVFLCIVQTHEEIIARAVSGHIVFFNYVFMPVGVCRFFGGQLLNYCVHIVQFYLLLAPGGQFDCSGQDHRAAGCGLAHIYFSGHGKIAERIYIDPRCFYISGGVTSVSVCNCPHSFHSLHLGGYRHCLRVDNRAKYICDLVVNLFQCLCFHRLVVVP